MHKTGLRRVFATFVVGVLVCAPFAQVRAEASVASLQAQINSLLQVIAQLQAQLGTVSGGSNGSSASCIALTRTLYVGLSDAETGGEVTKLQRFLGMNPTGFFGPMTEAKVKAWQAQKGIVSSGDADTTGYGLVGARTRALMNQCGGSVNAPKPNETPTDPDVPSCTIKTSNPTPKVGEKFTISWTTKNMERVVMNEGTKGGGAYVVLAEGSKTFTEYGVYNPTFGLGDGFGEDKVVCSLSVAVGGEMYEKPVISFSADETSIRTGEEVRLSWKVTNAQRCLLQYDSTEIVITNNLSGGIVDVAPTKDTTYRLWCANDPGTGKDGPAAEKTVKVYVEQPLCTIKVSEYTPSLYTAEKGKIYVDAGTSATVSWSAKNADYAVLNGDKVNLSGSANTGLFSVNEPTNEYTLKLYDGNELVKQCSTTIYVNQKG